MKTRHWICLTLTFLLCGGAAAAEDETVHYAVLADGKKIGHYIHARNLAPGKVITTETMELSVTRDQTSLKVYQMERCIETPQGEPLEFVAVQNLAAMTTRIKGKVTGEGKIHVTFEAAGQTRDKTLDWPQGAMMAEGIRLLGLKKGLREGTHYPIRPFVGSFLDAFEGQVKIGPTRKMDLLGRVVTLTEVVTELQSPTGPIITTSYVNQRQIPQKTVIPVMGMLLEMIACEKTVALSRNDPVDFLDKCALPCPVPPETFTAARSAAYTLEPIGKKKVTGIAATDSQTVRANKDGSLLVTVRPVKAPAGATFPYKGKDPAVLEALKPTRFLQSDDKKVIELARKAIGNTKDSAKAAKRIEAFVGSHVKSKTLSVGYATAAEVAASGEGDCSEHAVLAAAMCRAAGIPARVVLGYAHAPKFRKYENVFIGHAWVQAMIGDKWVDLDPTRGGISPGHIAQTVGNGDPSDFFELLGSLGYFKISKVVVEK